MCHQFAGNIQLDATSKTFSQILRQCTHQALAGCVFTFPATFSPNPYRPDALRCSGTHFTTEKGNLMSRLSSSVLTAQQCAASCHTCRLVESWLIAHGKVVCHEAGQQLPCGRHKATHLAWLKLHGIGCCLAGGLQPNDHGLPGCQSCFSLCCNYWHLQLGPNCFSMHSAASSRCWAGTYSAWMESGMTLMTEGV